MDTLKRLEPLFALLALISTIVGLFLVIVQIKDAEDSTNQLLRSANQNTVLQIMYSLSQELNTPINSSIYNHIDEGRKVRMANGGVFSDLEIENYLNDLEALGVLYDQNKESLTQNVFLCDTFFDVAKETLNNKEIRGFLEEQRKIFTPYQSYLEVLRQSVNDYSMCPEFN